MDWKPCEVDGRAGTSIEGCSCKEDLGEQDGESEFAKTASRPRSRSVDGGRPAGLDERRTSSIVDIEKGRLAVGRATAAVRGLGLGGAH